LISKFSWSYFTCFCKWSSRYNIKYNCCTFFIWISITKWNLSCFRCFIRSRSIYYAYYYFNYYM